MRGALMMAVLLAAPAAGDWLQEGGGSGRERFVPDPIPADPDVLLRVDFDGYVIGWQPTLVMDDHLYLAASPFPDVPDVGPGGLKRIALANGTIDTVWAAGPDDVLTGLGGDGRRGYFVAAGALNAWNATTGVVDWSLDLPPAAVGPSGQALCGAPAILGNRLYMGCRALLAIGAWGGQDATGVDTWQPYAFSTGAVLLAVDLAQGEIAWSWQPAFDNVSDNLFDAVATGGGVGEAWDAASKIYVAADADRVVVTFYQRGSPSKASALDHDGNWLWDYPIYIHTIPVQSEEQALRYLAAAPTQLGTNIGLMLYGGELVFANHYLGRWVGGEDGVQREQAQWPVPPPPAAFANWVGTAVAQRGNDVVALAAGRLFETDAASGAVHGVSGTIPEFFSPHPALVATPGAVVTAGAECFTTAWRSGFSEDDAPLWAVAAGPRDDRLILFGCMLSADGGRIIVTDWSGRVTVLGSGPSGIRIDARASTLYPAPGEEIVLDLSASEPGVQADDIAFAVEWGDATQTLPQGEQTLAHTYATSGDHVVTVHAENSAGQSSTHRFTVFVGAPAPRDPTLLEDAFSQENQERTFFILGLAITAAAALWGVWRLRRRRGTLHDEMEKLESDYTRLRDQPALCERMLAERRESARSLFAAKRLEEPQFALLRDRIDELAKRSRIDEAESELAFLPVGIARQMEEMLADGRIQAWERAHIDRLLRETADMPRAYAARVLKLLDDWERRDAARAAGG